MKKLRLSLIFNEREEEEEKVGEEEEEEDTMAGTHTRRLRNIISGSVKDLPIFVFYRDDRE